MLEKLAAEPLRSCGEAASWGVDFRSCWNKMRDMAGDLVCGASPILALAKGDFGSIKLDTAGNSPSTIVASLPKFMIKSVSALELSISQEAFQKMSAAAAEQTSGCFRTALAPTCAALLDSTGQAWTLVRKIEIEGGTKSKVGVGRGQENWFDLKGPKFSNTRDMKTYLNYLQLAGAPNVWRNKDLGFTRAFPHGLRVGNGSLSREVASVLLRDSNMLMDNEMTDFSLFVSFWKGAPASQCTGTMQGTFPLTIPVEGGRSLALGIIDYTERTFRSHANGKMFSTMRDPREFRAYWMTMWPKYFKLPAGQIRTLPASPSDEHPAAQRTDESREVIREGDVMIALQEMKWQDDTDIFSAAFSVFQSKRYVHTNLMDPGEYGSDFKVYPGARGRVRGFKGRQLLISWKDCPGGEKTWKHQFAVPAGAVMKDNSTTAESEYNEAAQMGETGARSTRSALTRPPVSSQCQDEDQKIEAYLKDAKKMDVVDKLQGFKEEIRRLEVQNEKLRSQLGYQGGEPAAPPTDNVAPYAPLGSAAPLPPLRPLLSPRCVGEAGLVEAYLEHAMQASVDRLFLPLKNQIAALESEHELLSQHVGEEGKRGIS